MAKKKVSYTTLILAIVATVFVCFLVYAKFDDIVELFSGPQEQLTILEEVDLEVGDALELTGMLDDNGDVRYYAYTLQTQEYGLVGLKSKTINLGAYTGAIKIIGDVVGSNEKVIIIEVESISLLLEEKEDVQIDDIVSDAVYLRNAGIFLPEDFFQKYSLAETSSKNIVSFSDADGTTYAVNYFVCSTGGSDTDCTKLKETFATSSSKSFTISNGMTFYKLAEIDSRFADNDGLFGYFFNDMPESTVIQLTRDIVFPTIKSVEQQVVPSLTQICTDGIVALGSVDTYSLVIKGGSLHLDVVGTVGENQATCDVTIDYAQSKKAVLTQFDVKDTDQQEDEEESDPQEVVTVPELIKRENPFDPDVEQFPINLEKPFEFNSNRDHSISFPSMNISFAGDNIDTDLGFPGTRCYTQIHVVSYPNKELIKTQPSIILYECSRISADETFPTEYVIYPVVEGKTFVVHVMDGSRRDFANNISIQQQ